MKKTYKNLIWGIPISLLLTGCIDDKYDLSDIDTTSEFKVNDLVLPLNLDPVLLSDIIKVEEGDQLKEITVNGVTFYGVEQSGSFYSDGIYINTFEADQEDMLEDRTATFKPSADAARKLKGKAPSGNIDMIYELENPVLEDLDYEATGINGAIRDLTNIFFQPLVFSIEIYNNNMPDNVESAFENIVLTLPAGLTVSEIYAGGENYPVDQYNPEDGTLILPSIAVSNNRCVINITAVALDLSSYPNAFNYDEISDSGTFSLPSSFNIEKSNLKLSGPAETLATVAEISYTVHYELGNLFATSILGNIYYNLEGTGLYIDPINLENRPSFLDDPQTKLVLSNPQIYLGLQNPIGKYGLYYQSKFDIISIWENEQASFTSPLVALPKKEGTFNYLLSPNPDNVTNIPEDYSKDINRLVYANLGNILNGDGLPDKLDIEILNPLVPEQTVTSPFELGQNIEGMEGTYMFIAPLALKEGSTIVKTVDGWWSEDLSDLTITKLVISADATSTLPMGVELHVYPIDKDGNRIENVAETIVNLPAMAENHSIEMMMQGVITDLDGIEIYVMAASNDDEPLAPDQQIILENLKAKVTGSYTKKL